MPALILGLAERAQLADLTARAAASPTPYAMMRSLAQASPAHAEEIRELNRALTVEVPDGFTVTLTHEEHKPDVLCRHVSIGVRTTPGRGPAPGAVEMLMDALGFVNRLGRLPTWTETLADGTFAVNLVEPLDGDLRKLAEDTPPGDGRKAV